MDFTTLLTTIINLMMTGLSSMATGLGDGINSILSHLFFVYSEGAVTSNLSTFAGLTIIWGSIALALGIGRLLVKWITGWGKNRYM